jgi:hypothetical protein
MALTVYRTSQYVNWKSTSGTLINSGTTIINNNNVTLSNYYTKIELQTSGSASVHFDNITSAYHNHLLGLEGGSIADTGESSGGAGQYYHLDLASYTWVLARGSGGDSFWLEDSIGDLYTVTSGAGLYIDEIFIKNDIIDAQDGSLRHLTITAGDASGAAGTDAGNLILKAGNAISGDAGSTHGRVYIVPGNHNSGGQSGYINLGDSNSNFNSVQFQAEGSVADVGIGIYTKGDGLLSLTSDTQIVLTAGDRVSIQGDLLTIGVGDVGVTILAYDGNSGVDGCNISLRGGKSATGGGNWNGGDVFIYGGAASGLGSRGDVYFGDGANGYLRAAESDDTDVVYYNSTTGRLSYGAEGGGVTPIDSTLLDWSTNKYQPYAAQADGAFDTSSSMPIHTTRLNYGGYFYATRLYTNEIETSSSTATHAIRAITTGAGAGVSVTNNTGPGIDVSSSGSAGIWIRHLSSGNGLYIGDASGYASSGDLLKIEKTVYGTGDALSNFIVITDNPTTSGTKSGKILSVVIGSTERILFNPRAVDEATAVPYFLDTAVNLTTTGAKLLSIRNNGSEKLYVDKDGDVYSQGNMYADDFVLNSDERLKTNIKPYDPNYLDIEYKQFEFINNPEQTRFGVIAQELQKLYPELVREGVNGSLSVSYTDLLVREVSYLKSKIQELEDKWQHIT